MSKLNPLNGQVLWTRLIGDYSWDIVRSVSTGADGAVYVAGEIAVEDTYTWGDPGENRNGFVIKLNPDNGNVLWTTTISSTRIPPMEFGSADGYAVKVGADGAVYVAGKTDGSLFGPANTLTTASGGGFVSKLNPVNGTVEWTRMVGGIGSQPVYSIAAGADGTVYVAGETTSALDGQTHLGQNNWQSSTTNIFLSKLPAHKSITFAPGSATATLTIKTTADAQTEGSETVTVTVAAGTGYKVGTSLSATGAVKDAIDLGNSSLLGDSQLIAPVQVEGKWYYHLDRNNDGTIAGDVYTKDGDAVTAPYLLSDVYTLFKQDINGVDGPSTGHTHRYATVNGVKLALPTLGSSTPTSPVTGTLLNNPSQVNSSYDDLSAIWDAYNGTGVGSYLGQGLTGNWGASNITSGAPRFWVNDAYVSATPNASEYAFMRFYDGFFGPHGTGAMHVALQVLNPATFASAQYRRESDTLQLTGSDFLSLGNVDFDIKSYIDWSIFDYDTNGDGAVDVNFALADIASAKVISESVFEVVLNAGSSSNPIGAYKLENAGNFDSGYAAVGGADKLILGANAANNYSKASTMGVVQSLAGQSTIDLGSYGQLIAPVQVEGKWYYYWDRNDDGTSAGDGYNKIPNSQNPTYPLSEIYNLFKQDINGITGAATNDTHRYAVLNGVKLALPEIGGAATNNSLHGTSVSGTQFNNSAYDGLAAIWDAHNGAKVGSYFDKGLSYTGESIGGYDSGAPPAWVHGSYVSATPLGPSGEYAYIRIYDGLIEPHANWGMNVALQVL